MRNGNKARSTRIHKVKAVSELGFLIARDIFEFPDNYLLINIDTGECMEMKNYLYAFSQGLTNYNFLDEDLSSYIVKEKDGFFSITVDKVLAVATGKYTTKKTDSANHCQIYHSAIEVKGRKGICKY